MLYIAMRETLDWQDESAVDAGLIGRFRPKLEMWNATFNIRYHEFRQRVKTIAQLNLDRIEDARLVHYEDVPPGALLVPVDDDDWFAPDVGHRLHAADDPSKIGFYWTRHVLEPERHRRRYKSLLKEVLTRRIMLATNNYALRQAAGLAIPAENHLAASRYFQARRNAVKYVPAALSMHNRNLASQTALAFGQPSLPRDTLIAAFERYRRLYARTHLSPALRWAAPYVALMADLMQDLKLR